jgi:hypothetical protein
MLDGGGGCIFLQSFIMRHRQMDLCEFEVCLVYRVSSRTARPTHREMLSKKKKKKTKVLRGRLRMRLGGKRFA